MECPVCKVTLQMTERSGIEVDFCPKCRGVWLDRGELDKIIERTSRSEVPAQHVQSPPPPPHPGGYMPDPDSDYGRGHHGYPPRKRKSILGEIFDF